MNTVQINALFIDQVMAERIDRFDSARIAFHDAVNSGSAAEVERSKTLMDFAALDLANWVRLQAVGPSGVQS
jgi:hypothetical protein